MKKQKKNEARYTIKFNTANPRHREAMRILDKTCRGKAGLIADALCMFSHYGAGATDDLLNEGKRRFGVYVPDLQGVDGGSFDKTGSELSEDEFWKNVGDFVGAFFD